MASIEVISYFTFGQVTISSILKIGYERNKKFSAHSNGPSILNEGKSRPCTTALFQNQRFLSKTGTHRNDFAKSFFLVSVTKSVPSGFEFSRSKTDKFTNARIVSLSASCSRRGATNLLQR
jgi:hypothetical protein